MKILIRPKFNTIQRSGIAALLFMWRDFSGFLQFFDNIMAYK